MFTNTSVLSDNPQGTKPLETTEDQLPNDLPPAGAIETSLRFDSIDILRGLALFGVLLVNLLTEFRVSIFAQFLPDHSVTSQVDRFAMQFVHYGLELKAFALFSFLFGVGLAMQFERLSKTGRPLYWLTRRLLVLLIFGLIHLLLIWNGDILTEYALAGLIVLPLLYAPRSVLASAGIALLALYLVLPNLPVPIPWPDSAWITHHVEEASRIYAVGNWWQVMHFNVQEIPALMPLHAYIFPRTLGLFVLGMLAWRSGIFARPAEYKSAIVSVGWSLGSVGLALSFTEAYGLLPATGLFSLLTNTIPIFLALAFAALVLYLVEFTTTRATLRTFTAIGRTAFTNYIGQSVIFGLIFFGYGLGQFGRLRPAPVFALGVIVYIAQVLLSQWWLRQYKFGPIEWVWRTLMYGHRQPMKR